MWNCLWCVTRFQTIYAGGSENATEIVAAFDAVNQTEGGMCAMINTGSASCQLHYYSLCLFSQRFVAQVLAENRCAA